MRKTIDIPEEVAEKIMVAAIKSKPRMTFKKLLEQIIINSKEAKA